MDTGDAVGVGPKDAFTQRLGGYTQTGGGGGFSQTFVFQDIYAFSWATNEPKQYEDQLVAFTYSNLEPYFPAARFIYQTYKIDFLELVIDCNPRLISGNADEVNPALFNNRCVIYAVPWNRTVRVAPSVQQTVHAGQIPGCQVKSGRIYDPIGSALLADDIEASSTQNQMVVSVSNPQYEMSPFNGDASDLSSTGTNYSNSALQILSNQGINTTQWRGIWVTVEPSYVPADHDPFTFELDVIVKFGITFSGMRWNNLPLAPKILGDDDVDGETPTTIAKYPTTTNSARRSTHLRRTPHSNKPYNRLLKGLAQALVTEMQAATKSPKP